MWGHSSGSMARAAMRSEFVDGDAFVTASADNAACPPAREASTSAVKGAREAFTTEAHLSVASGSLDSSCFITQG